MAKICYTPRKFQVDSLAIIAQANTIIEEYQDQGLALTLRQLYYQFVSRDLIANQQKEYKRLGSIINDGRLAGLIDWDAIEDRTRSLKALSHWDSPSDIVAACASSYRIDKWRSQPNIVEVWVEKEALAGVIEAVCGPLDVNSFACRGYVSQSEMWAAAQRMRLYNRTGHKVVVLHLGDHDPSGIDMTRDITDRLQMFKASVEVRRIALNFSQIEEYDPPPNPAKDTDSRFARYRVEYGDSSWELDALDPKTLRALITSNILSLRDEKLWKAGLERESAERQQLKSLSSNWDDVVTTLSDSDSD